MCLKRLLIGTVEVGIDVFVTVYGKDVATLAISMFSHNLTAVGQTFFRQKDIWGFDFLFLCLCVRCSGLYFRQKDR